jgi:hypothetical protein
MAADETQKRVNGAVFAGVLVVANTVVVTLISFRRPIPGISAWNFGNAAIGAALTYGIYRHSRVCAVAMLAYVIIGQLWLSIHAGLSTVETVAVMIILGCLFVAGIRGTVAYHKGLTKRSSQPPPGEKIST